MEKVVLTLWRTSATTADELASWAATAIPQLRDTDALLGARVLIEAPEGAALRWGAPVDDTVFCGLVSLWLPSYQDLEIATDVVAAAPIARWHGYLVAESAVRSYPQQLPWELGDRSFGLSQATLFDKLPGISDEEF